MTPHRQRIISLSDICLFLSKMSDIEHDSAEVMEGSKPVVLIKPRHKSLFYVLK